MTNYREILQLAALGFSQQNIAYSCNVSKKTVNRVLPKARERNISWPLDNDQTNAVLATQFFIVEDKPSTVKKQAKQINGYQIQYSTKKTFKSGNKSLKVNKATIVSKTITKLKAKKKYFVRIRTYKKVSGKTYYSSWSKVKAVKTK